MTESMQTGAWPLKVKPKLFFPLRTRIVLGDTHRQAIRQRLSSGENVQCAAQSRFVSSFRGVIFTTAREKPTQL